LHLLLAFCTLTLAEPLSGQQNSGSDSPRMDRARPAPSQNPDLLPNAPSTSRANSDEASQSPLTTKERVVEFRHAMFSLWGLTGPALGSAVGQWEDEPREWRQGTRGYARRFSSGVGRHFIAETIRFGVATADGEDPRYHPSQETKIWRRGLHAVAETFTSRTADGSRMPAYSRFAGIYAAAFISNSWYPESRANTRYALRRGSTALASGVCFHLVEEFFPRGKSKSLHAREKTDPHSKE
jgi:hypothetical protein